MSRELDPRERVTVWAVLWLVVSEMAGAVLMGLRLAFARGRMIVRCCSLMRGYCCGIYDLSHSFVADWEY